MSRLLVSFALPLLLGGTFLVSQGQENPEPFDVIIVAGQSNAVGYDAKPKDLPADPADQQILYWYRCGDPPPDDHDTTSGGKWTHLQPVPRGNPNKEKKIARQYGNFAQPEGGFGPEMSLARTLRAKEGKPLAVVKAAFSGTSIYTDWHPTDPGAAGACYRALVKEVRAALAAGEGKKFRLRAFAWIQGESDAARSAGYEKALTDMLAALRKDLKAPELAALLAVNTKFGGEKNLNMPKLVEAQKAAAEKDPRAIYVDTSKCSIANSAHFDSAGTLEVGRLMAQALWKIEAPSRK